MSANEGGTTEQSTNTNTGMGSDSAGGSDSPHEAFASAVSAIVQRDESNDSADTADGQEEAKGEATAAPSPSDDRAKEYGLDDEAIALLGDNAATILDKLEMATVKKAIEAAKGASTDKPVEKPAEGKTDSEKPAPVSGGMKESISALLKEAAFEEDDAMYAALMKVAEAQDSAMQSVLSKISEFESKINSGDSIVQEAASQRHTESIDNFFIGMKDKYGNVLGDKPIGEYAPDSPEAIKRNEIVENANAIIVGMQTLGKSAPTFSEALQKAAKMTLAEFDKKIAREELSAKAVKRQSSLIGKPGTVSSPDRVLSREEQDREFANKLRAITSKGG